MGREEEERVGGFAHNARCKGLEVQNAPHLLKPNLRPFYMAQVERICS